MTTLYNIHHDRHSYYRADIDGLRAVAILLVVFGHAYTNILPSGFIGVDIFFVISGFLITRIILQDIAAGQFHFLRFLGRRIRRLFPALILVLLVTWLGGLYLLLPIELTSLSQQVVASALYGNNILNYYEAGYFDDAAMNKPLLHTWSLGVEEQYYLCFPLILLLILRMNVSVVWAFVLLGLLSFEINVHLVYHNAPAAFYLPFARLWEFLVGGMFAYGDIHKKSYLYLRHTWHHQLAALLGIVFITIAAIHADSILYPGWWALFPVMGTALIIISPKSLLHRYILSNKAFVFVGLVSYAFYLWHWPLLVLAHQYDAPSHEYLVLLAVASAFILAVITYHFVEVPVLKRKRPVHQTSITYLLLIMMIFIAVAAAYTIQQKGFLAGYHEDIKKVLATEPPDDLARIDSVTNTNRNYILLTGDSHAEHLYEGLTAQAQHLDMDVVLHRWQGCRAGFWDVNNRCRTLYGQYIKELEQRNPTVIVLSAYWGLYQPLEYLEGYITQLKPYGTDNIVIIGQMASWDKKLPVVIYDAYINNPDNGLPKRLLPPAIGSETSVERDVINATLSQMATKHRVAFINPTDYLCNEDGCEVVMMNQKVIQYDKSHFTPEGSIYFINKIRDNIFTEK